VIACTQRPDKDAVPGQIKANIPATVAFQVRARVNSEILLGETNYAAAALPPWAGRGIWQWDGETHMQTPLLERDDAERRVAVTAFGPAFRVVKEDQAAPEERGQAA
jgi:DNA segregation ATPase FtsK/SpoIIIE-like protein